MYIYFWAQQWIKHFFCPSPPPRASKLRGQVWISLYLLSKLVYLNGNSLAWVESVQLDSLSQHCSIYISATRPKLNHSNALFLTSERYSFHQNNQKKTVYRSSSWLFAVRHTWLYIVTEESRLGRNSRNYTNETPIDCLINKEAFHVSSSFLYVQKFTSITYRLLLWESMKHK